MAFTDEHYHDFIRLLYAHPEWRADLRRLLLELDPPFDLSKTLQELSEATKALAEAQSRGEERIDRIEAAIEKLAEAQAHTDMRIKELIEAQARTEQSVKELAQAQARTEERMGRLETAVEKLAEAQARTEERVGRLEIVVERLAEAQARTEERVGRLEIAVEKLAEAQVRTEERVGRLEIAVEKLAEAQVRTEERVGRLEIAVDDLAKKQERTNLELRRLSDRVGVSVEEEAESVMQVVLEDKGYRLVDAPFNLRMNGEVDVVLPLQDVEGRSLWAVVEAKTRLGYRTVETWSQRMRSSGFQARLQKHGVEGPYLVYAYGMRVDVSAQRAAKKFGVGLVSSQGEIIAPQGVLHPTQTKKMPN
ncbi:MAG: hypothetical protein GXP42_11575 [Chloroflexi bacterium]|nr:hypothetical protein [Chloroflexota bacterium]